MSATAAAVAAPIGAVVGLGAGWLSVYLERVEKLEAEEREDREEFERDVAAARIAAADSGEPPPTEQPWRPERYGWTWLERVLCPILGAAGFAAFAAHEPFGKDLVIHLVWVTIFVQIVGFDLKHRLILNRVTYPAMVLALALAQVSPGLDIWRSLGGLVAVGLFFVVQNVVSQGWHRAWRRQARRAGRRGLRAGAGPRPPRRGVRGDLRDLPRWRHSAAAAGAAHSQPEGPDPLWPVPVHRGQPHALPRAVTSADRDGARAVRS